MFGPEDEEDFTPAGNSSKLASLFGTAMEEGNASLTYTAPKQPKKARSESGTSSKDLPGKLSIIVVQAVQTYKLEGSNYINQGKLGAALLGNTTSKLYQLLLYKTKQQHVTSTKITDKFQFTVQAQNFASFYDDKGQNWSIMFESETNAIDFAREVGLARACTQNEKGQQSFYVQDLKVGDGSGAEMGDLLNIRYTTLPLVNGRLEKAIESNVDADKPQRVSIRKGVWEEALVGSTQGCKRLIILAPVLFGPWKPLADAKHQLAVEVEVGRIKSRRRSRESSPLDIFNNPESSESNVDSSTDETSIKARGASISEALTNSPKTHKASIISRMARMGQATLPLKGAVVCNPSDSEETEEESSVVPPTTSVPLKSILKPRSLSGKRISASPHVSLPSTVVSQTAETTASAVGGSTFTLAGPSTVSAQQMSVYQPSLGWPPQNQPAQYLINGVPINFATPSEGQLFASPHHQVVPVPAVLPTPSGTPSSESHLSVFLSESRTHNAEVRMGLTKVADKIDIVLGKVETLQQPASSGVLEPRTLLASIQKLVLENEQLQTELADKRVKLEQQNEKIYQLLQHKIMEQSSSAPALDQRQDDSLQVVMVGLQHEKTKLSSDLADAVTKINNLQIQTNNYERICIELREEIKNLTARLQTAYIELDHTKEALIEQEGLMRSLKEKTDASVNLHETQDSVINGLHMKLKDSLAAKTVLEEALTESKQQLEHVKIKMSEEMTIMQSNHKEEIIRLEKKYKEQFDEAMKNNVNCSENSCNHLNDLRKMEKENEELKSNVSDLKTRLSTSADSYTEDIKKVMNVMFKLLKSEFIPGTSYDGTAIRETMLSSIQNVTLQYMKMKAAANEKMNSTQRVVPEENKISSKATELYATNRNEITNDSIKTELIKTSLDSSNSNGSDSKSEEKVQSDSIKEYDEKLIDKREIEAKDKCSTETKPTVVEPELETKSDVEKPQSGQKQDSKVNDEDSKDMSLGSNLQVAKPRESSIERGWRPQPPPSPLFDDEEDDDDWLS